MKRRSNITNCFPPPQRSLPYNRDRRLAAAAQRGAREVRHAGEESKVAVRNLRREANDHLKKLIKEKLASEDEERRAQEEVQRLTDRVVAEVDRLVQAKEAEVLAV